jgi:hypothetical protein
MGLEFRPMSTIHNLIAAADRQIERTKLRIQRQIVHTENLELGNFQPEAKRAHAVLNRRLAELSLLQQHRLSLYPGGDFCGCTDKDVVRVLLW